MHDLYTCKQEHTSFTLHHHSVTGRPRARSQEGANKKEGPPEPLAYARLHKGEKLNKQFCMGGTWRLNINEFAGGFWADPRSREVLMVMATVKAVRDADRDNMGRVSEERCSEAFWLSIALVGTSFTLTHA